MEAFGGAVTFTVLVAVTAGQLPEAGTVYVIILDPAATPVTTPVVAFTVATVGVPLDHVPPVPVVVNVVVPVPQIVLVPLIVPALPGVETVTVLVAVTAGQGPDAGTV